MPKCKCCGEEITDTQNNWSGVCPSCDLGRCHKPEEYHKLQRRLRELQQEIKELRLKDISKNIQKCPKCKALVRVI